MPVHSMPSSFSSLFGHFAEFIALVHWRFINRRNSSCFHWYIFFRFFYFFPLVCTQFFDVIYSRRQQMSVTLVRRMFEYKIWKQQLSVYKRNTVCSNTRILKEIVRSRYFISNLQELKCPYKKNILRRIIIIIKLGHEGYYAKKSLLCIQNEEKTRKRKTKEKTNIDFLSSFFVFNMDRSFSNFLFPSLSLCSLIRTFVSYLSRSYTHTLVYLYLSHSYSFSRAR